MIVCICNQVSDREIRRCAAAGLTRFEELQAATRCSTCCGCCEGTARQLFQDAVDAVARASAASAAKSQPVRAVGSAQLLPA